MSETTNDNNERRSDDILERFKSIFLKDQPDVAVEKIGRFLDSAADLANYLADQIAEDAKPRHTAIKGKGLIHTLQVIFASAAKEPEKLAHHYSRFAAAVIAAVRSEITYEPDAADRRFKDPLWRDSDFYRTLLQIYLAWNKYMQAWIEDQDLDEDDLSRVNLVFEQFSAAFAPSNLPLNPGAMRRAERSNGMSSVQGIRNVLEDVRTNRGMPRQIREDAYCLGIDIATTPGSVVYCNELLELIQYQPTTAEVRTRPILLIPAQINKYYVFDLKAQNSFIGHCLDQGFQTFTISWTNTRDMSPDWGLDDYIVAALGAIEAIRTITGSSKINVMSACAGGFTTLALLGYLAETGNELVHTHSLFVTSVLTDCGSILEAMATPELADMARIHVQRDGTMDGKTLAHVFAWLRPKDLVWNYWVNNNLMGRDPPPLDVLYWDNDSTRVPAALHSDFFSMYENAVFERPHAHRVLGVPIDYRNIEVDTYFTAGIEDYLMPWPACYRGAKHFRGRNRFVLSDGGHVQSMLRPPRLARARHYINDELPPHADDWLAAAEEKDGTWWHDWYAWLHHYAGDLQPAPRRLGSAEHPPLTDAPGCYALERL